jgi:hypothetical protein
MKTAIIVLLSLILVGVISIDGKMSDIIKLLRKKLW